MEYSGTGCGMKAGAEAFVMSVTAGRKHDASASPDQNFLAAAVEPRTRDATPIANKIDDRRIEHDWHVVPRKL